MGHSRHADQGELLAGAYGWLMQGAEFGEEELEVGHRSVAVEEANLQRPGEGIARRKRLRLPLKHI